MTRLFVNQLTVIDFAYLDHQRGVVGDSWIVDIELHGTLDEQGMVFDFGLVKKQIKQYIDNEIDHRLLVPSAANCTHQLNGDELSIKFDLQTGEYIIHRSPQQAVLLLDSVDINKEYIRKYLQTNLLSIMPANVQEVRIQLRSESAEGYYYQYTHGLQKHLGHCQRIAHGHRSQIEIWVDSERQSSLEAKQANAWQDIYIATETHIKEQFNDSGSSYYRLAYAAQEGEFEIVLPCSRVTIMPVESTVENIADHLATNIANEHSIKVVVKAFEGLDKGAYGEAS